jgi:mannose-1-phosphate guanylyltransferase
METKKEAWVIVLAGGEGARMRPVVERWLGKHRPKQYCAFSGGRTMLEHTMDRALALAPAERIITVTGPGHHVHLKDHPALPGRVIEQPSNRETAPGLYLPLAHILREDPDATVLVLPSDHFIRPRERFVVEAKRALSLADRQPGKIAMLAVMASRPETDYGWIEPSEPVPGEDAAWTVTRFHEKPDARTAERLARAGFLWNTMIFAARARALWSLGGRLRPDMMGYMDGVKAALGTGRQFWALEEAYLRMPSVNFSRDLLERDPTAVLMVPLMGVSWCDWGRPERVSETLRALGRPDPFVWESVPA